MSVVLPRRRIDREPGRQAPEFTLSEQPQGRPGPGLRGRLAWAGRMNREPSGLKRGIPRLQSGEEVKIINWGDEVMAHGENQLLCMDEVPSALRGLLERREE